MLAFRLQTGSGRQAGCSWGRSRPRAYPGSRQLVSRQGKGEYGCEPYSDVGTTEGAILHAPAFRRAKWSSPSERHLVGRARRGDVVERLTRMPLLDLVMKPSKAPRSVRTRSVFNAETAWLDPVRLLLARDPHFVVVEASDFPLTGYRLTTYRQVIDTVNGSRRGGTR
jgi:hypothetical protein